MSAPMANSHAQNSHASARQEGRPLEASGLHGPCLRACSAGPARDAYLAARRAVE
jgi:hypothetical protein